MTRMADAEFNSIDTAKTLRSRGPCDEGAHEEGRRRLAEVRRKLLPRMSVGFKVGSGFAGRSHPGNCRTLSSHLPSLGHLKGSQESIEGYHYSGACAQDRRQ